MLSPLQQALQAPCFTRLTLLLLLLLLFHPFMRLHGEGLLVRRTCQLLLLGLLLLLQARVHHDLSCCWP